MAHELYERLMSANDDYHEAVNEILQNDLDTEMKVQFAAAVNKVFENMKRAAEVIEEHYREE